MSCAPSRRTASSSNRVREGVGRPARRKAYLALRDRYEPERIKLVVIAESPPVSGRYFYDAAGVPTEPLFAALMRHLGLNPLTKEAGLREFRRRGWILIDATYEPVNALSSSHRDEVIVRDYPLLRSDLSGLLPDRSVPVALIKANVCRILEHRLAEDGFSVLNGGRAVYFPSHGRQNDFQRAFGGILAAAGIGST